MAKFPDWYRERIEKIATLKTGKAKGDWEFDAFVRGANEILNDLERLGMQEITLGEYFVVSVSVPVRREDAVKHQWRLKRK